VNGTPLVDNLPLPTAFGGAPSGRWTSPYLIYQPRETTGVAEGGWRVAPPTVVTRLLKTLGRRLGSWRGQVVGPQVPLRMLFDFSVVGRSGVRCLYGRAAGGRPPSSVDPASAEGPFNAFAGLPKQVSVFKARRPVGVFIMRCKPPNAARGRELGRQLTLETVGVRRGKALENHSVFGLGWPTTPGSAAHDQQCMASPRRRLHASFPGGSSRGATGRQQCLAPIGVPLAQLAFFCAGNGVGLRVVAGPVVVGEFVCGPVARGLGGNGYVASGAGLTGFAGLVGVAPFRAGRGAADVSHRGIWCVGGR